jgi:hypothetical protein
MSLKEERILVVTLVYLDDRAVTSSSIDPDRVPQLTNSAMYER